MTDISAGFRGHCPHVSHSGGRRRFSAVRENSRPAVCVETRQSRKVTELLGASITSILGAATAVIDRSHSHVQHGKLADTQKDLAAAQARIGALEEEITRLRQLLASFFGASGKCDRWPVRGALLDQSANRQIAR
jgi:hypothetical protein